MYMTIVFRKETLISRNNKLVCRKEKLISRKNTPVFRKDKLQFRKLSRSIVEGQGPAPWPGQASVWVTHFIIFKFKNK